ncbi:hypothetical protein GCM10022279_32660 [Comamonas faecalis]|uniref:HTH luxR-type domain-containing protein n=1 Tax=Comamonas faecalis TaxID=1387849 RepID=A0ABP7S3A7_9BURK
MQADHARHLPQPGDTMGALLQCLYAGISQATPWQDFAEQLRLHLAARTVCVTLHHSEDESQDVYVMASIPADTIDWAQLEATYRAEWMEDDPLRPSSMEPGQISLAQAAQSAALKSGLLKDAGISQNLRLCAAEPGGMRCWIDVIRSRDLAAPEFSAADLALMHALLPHITQALGLYAQLRRQEAETAIYQGMVEHFSLGCILIDHQRKVIHTNSVATALLQRRLGVSLAGSRLVLAQREAQAVFDEALSGILAAHEKAGTPPEGVAVRVGDYHDRLLGLLVYPAPLHHYYRSGQAPCAVVYVSDLTAGLDVLRPGHSHSLQRVVQLFGLTRQEATLALLLAHGSSLAQAAREMGVAEVAARNYSKKIYSKMGISSQADLIRIVLRSVSFLRR